MVYPGWDGPFFFRWHLDKLTCPLFHMWFYLKKINTPYCYVNIDMPLLFQDFLQYENIIPVLDRSFGQKVELQKDLQVQTCKLRL